MREDNKVDSKALPNSKALTGGKGIYDYRLSFSGNERNHLFLNQGGEQFLDLSGVSGVDHDGDSRSFAKLDFDRDGWIDIAMVNNNAPLLHLYRNQLGDRSDATNRMVAVRLVGGNTGDQPSDEWSNRDGIGALIELKLQEGDQKRSLFREHRSGEGLAAQNSSTLVIGIGEYSEVSELVVRWPSGKTQDLGKVASGSLLTIFENSADSPDGQAAVIESYLDQQVDFAELTRSSPLRGDETFPVAFKGAKKEDDDEVRVRVYTTMASWCTACVREIPELRDLKVEFGDRIHIVGMPIDPADDSEKLRGFLSKFQPPYQLTDVSKEQLNAITKLSKDELGNFGAPVSFITDQDNRLLQIEWGPPSISDVRRIIETLGE